MYYTGAQISKIGKEREKMTRELCSLQGKGCYFLGHSLVQSSYNVQMMWGNTARAGRGLKLPPYAKQRDLYNDRVNVFISKHICIEGNVNLNHQRKYFIETKGMEMFHFIRKNINITFCLVVIELIWFKLSIIFIAEFEVS
jgi:hypothetical protein